MCLRFVFLLTTRVISLLRLSRRKEAWQTAEIVILRHQLAVLQRQQPRRLDLNWADRAWRDDSSPGTARLSCLRLDLRWFSLLQRLPAYERVVSAVAGCERVVDEGGSGG